MLPPRSGTPPSFPAERKQLNEPDSEPRRALSSSRFEADLPPIPQRRLPPRRLPQHSPLPLRPKAPNMAAAFIFPQPLPLLRPGREMDAGSGGGLARTAGAGRAGAGAAIWAAREFTSGALRGARCLLTGLWGAGTLSVFPSGYGVYELLGSALSLFFWGDVWVLGLPLPVACPLP